MFGPETMFTTNTKYSQHVFLSGFVCGIDGGGDEGMGGGIQNNIYGKIRFILKKKYKFIPMCTD